MSNGYELTDARIDEIITRSLSRYRGIVQPATPASAPTKTASYFKPPGGSTVSTVKHATELYKKYGGNEDSEKETNDNAGADQGEDAAIFADSAKNPKKSNLDTKFFPPATPTSTISNQLFWCFYIAHNGMFAYDTMGNAFVAENAFKYATIDRIRANMPHIKSQFKRYRMSLPNFEAELVTSKALSLSALVGLALCYDRNILYIDNRKYFEINATGYVAQQQEQEQEQEQAQEEQEQEQLAFTVIEKIKNRFCVFSVAEETAVAFASKLRRECRNTFWKMDSITSPLKSMSYYTVADLQDIYARLGIVQANASHAQKKPTKADLYAAIAQNI